MKSRAIVLLVALALVAAACNKNSNVSGDNNTVTPTPNPVPSDAPSPAPTSGPVTVTIMSSGYSPNNITVKSGTTVTFVNNDTKGHWPASNPHPTHTDLPGFDAHKSIPPGSSYSFVFTKVGTWGFHDHLFPTQGGKIIVE
jgi:plastocyanin